MSEPIDKKTGDCETACQTIYLDCTNNTFTGCVEVLRTCRLACRNGNFPPRGPDPFLGPLLQ
jgi:hypothetical protein